MEKYTFKSIMEASRADEIAAVITDRLRGRFLILGVLVVAYMYLLSYKLMYQPVLFNIVCMLLVDGITTLVMFRILHSNLKNLHHKTAQRFIEQIETAGEDGRLERDVTFDGEAITLFLEEDNKIYQKKQVEKVLETAHMLVLVLKGGLYLCLDKDTIGGGSLESFRTYLGK